jgi:osmotically inducible protein OsmC
MKRKASAVWKGGLKDGKGTITTESEVLDKTQYSFSTRFEEGKGTNPEELIAAAHAGCFSMALSGQLGTENLTAESIETTATVRLEKVDSGFAVTEVHLEVKARVPGASEAAFNKAAENAKTGCPISKLFNTKISMDAKLETPTSVK